MVSSKPGARSKAPKRDQAREHARHICRLLGREYHDAECSLTHHNALQLLISTILSAQCTDERVNMVTPALFKKYSTAQAFANAKLPELEALIRSTGFYRNKAKNIQACCQQLVEEHGGHVPKTLEELVKLPGVGRKTANVVLGVAFDTAVGVVVDTHVTRLSHRMGLTKARTPEKIEQDLMALVPRDAWIAISHQMIQHGRRVCKARKPDCEHCVLNDVCPRIGVTSTATGNNASGAKPTTQPRRTAAVKG